jgi:hypothetical protein
MSSFLEVMFVKKLEILQVELERMREIDEFMKIARYGF